MCIYIYLFHTYLQFCAFYIYFLKIDVFSNINELISFIIFIDKIFFIAVLFFPSFLINISCQEISFNIRNFTKGDYNAEYQNWSITSGADGFIYCANNAGLLTYDGSSWELHSSPDINNIRSVETDSLTGRIYTSGYREIGYWVWDSIGSLVYHSLTPLAEQYYTKNEEFWKIIVLAADTVIFQSFSGIFI